MIDRQIGAVVIGVNAVQRRRKDEVTDAHKVRIVELDQRVIRCAQRMREHSILAFVVRSSQHEPFVIADSQSSRQQDRIEQYVIAGIDAQCIGRPKRINPQDVIRIRLWFAGRPPAVAVVAKRCCVLIAG